MTTLDYFISFLAALAGLLIFAGIATLSNRRLEMGALAGAIPLVWGLGIGAAAALLFALTHISIRIV